MSRRQLLIGAAVLVLVQALAITLYLVKRRRETEHPFAVETLGQQRAPELTYQRHDGSRGSLVSLRGKVVLVHFWATWCEPCREELPGLLVLADELAGKDFELLAVSVDDDWNAMTRFFDGRLPRSAVRPDGTDIHRRFGTSTLPDTYVVSASGQIVLRYAGARDWSRPSARDHLVQAIEQHRGFQ